MTSIKSENMRSSSTVYIFTSILYFKQYAQAQEYLNAVSAEVSANIRLILIDIPYLLIF